MVNFLSSSVIFDIGLLLSAQNVINIFRRNINLANMFDRYDNERTLWNLRYNICLQRFVIWNCDNLQLLVSLVAIKQLLIIIDNLFDPYCNNYSPQREQHDTIDIITHMSQKKWVMSSYSSFIEHKRICLDLDRVIPQCKNFIFHFQYVLIWKWSSEKGWNISLIRISAFLSWEKNKN